MTNLTKLECDPEPVSKPGPVLLTAVLNGAIPLRTRYQAGDLGYDAALRQLEALGMTAGQADNFLLGK